MAKRNPATPRTKAKNRSITFFRAKEAVDQATTGMREQPMQMSAATMKALAAQYEVSGGAGLKSNLLIRQDKGFSLLMVSARPNFPLPRHSHNSDCMYFVVSGSLKMGKRVLGPGDGFFVPADVVYVYQAGPEGVDVLEIRYGVNSYNIVMRDAPAKAWEADLAAVKANAERWKELDAQAAE